MKQRELRVFVVDDDQSVRASLAALLESDGYTVESFVSTADYLAKAPHSGAACLVLDVRLPGLDGLALQRQLAERGRMEQIVFITGHGDIPTGIQAMKRGAIDFLPKPFDGGALLSAKGQALARSSENWRKRDKSSKSARVSLRTIKTHRGRVMHKMGLDSAAELARLAQRAGVTPAPKAHSE